MQQKYWGEIQEFYIIIPFWDTLLHTLNGFLAAAIGFSLVVLLNDNQKLVFTMSPVFIAIVAFCFSMTIGVIWEFLNVQWIFFSPGYAERYGAAHDQQRDAGSRGRE